MESSDFIAVARHYFAEELKQAWVFLLLAALAAAAGVWLWRTQSAFRHALWPLALLAVLEAAVGAVALVRVPQRWTEVQASIQEDRPAFKDAESLRVTRMLDAFRFYKSAEIVLILVAIGLALFLSQQAVARGWALGLLFQAALLLAADLVAEQRAELYLDALRKL